VVVVVDLVDFFSTATPESGLPGSAGFTSTLLELDESVVVVGGGVWDGGVCTVTEVGAGVAAGGAC
jgi:hypothetical protein